MTFDEFWKQSGWGKHGAEIYEGTSEYSLAQDAYNAGQQSVRAEAADALAALRNDWLRQKIEAIDPSESLYPDQQGHNSLVGYFIEDLDIAIAALGLPAPTTKEKDELLTASPETITLAAAKALGITE